MVQFRKLLSSVFQQNCFLCSAKVSGEISICQGCLTELPLAPSPCCLQCGASANNQICGHCLTSKPYYDDTHALFSYAYPIDAVIQHYKYHNALYLSHTLATLLQEVMVDADIDTIIPMPLHPSRIKERGFNQSLEIAKVIAKNRNINLDNVSCTRIKDTPPQASLTPKDRVKNMKGAFDCKTSFTDTHIALIDDVMTTGSSLNELAKTLKAAGASKISCYVVARTA